MERPDIKDIVDKYIAGDYTPDELERLLAYLEQDDTSLFDQKIAGRWEALSGQPGAETDTERAGFIKEARQIIRQSAEKENKAKVKQMRLGYIWKVAASVAAIITSFWVFSRLDSSGTKAEDISVTVTAGSGEMKDIALPDGSSVTLNSESKLEYPQQFIDDVRVVILTGEAFFQVAHNSDRKFIVRSPDMAVEVTGTSFNIKDYQCNEISAVTVSTGKVFVKVDDSITGLSAGDRLLVNKNTGTFSKQTTAQPEKYSSWRNGSLYFDHTPITEVVEILQRRYGVHIKLQGDIDVTISISGAHDNKTLEAVLESICFMAGLKYRKTADGYILYC